MKKTIKKRAFVSAIAMLIVSAIVLTSSTFAWFSMSKEASVESMDLTVSSPEGIQISANASAWTASLTVDEIFDNDDATTSRYDAYEGNNNLYPADLIPVSSAFRAANSSTGYANFFKAALNDSGRATATAVTQSKDSQDAAGLIAFDLFFKVAEAQTVYFGTSTFTDNSNSKILSALRVAFTPLGTVSIGTDAVTAQGLNAFAAGTKNVVYEVDSLNRSDDAIAAGLTAGAKETKPLTSTFTNVETYGGVVAAAGNINTVQGTLVTDKTDASAKSFNLSAGITKVRVYIWVEGQDVDCLNSVAGAALTANLKFTID
ncbi:MAG: hypothetical protein IJ349_11180 [Clostridia bacterium]|nr:hypothetical protein [Clostridia bacterium]MBQ7862747.1 hypothetical protein [Clostridia bacterium]